MRRDEEARKHENYPGDNTAMTNSRYLLQKTDKSYCPGCRKHVDLLCTDEEMLKALRRYPWFYICWHCKRVYELGRGEVKRDES